MTAIGLAVVYFGLWPILQPWDSQGPVAFISTGSIQQLVYFATIVWIFAAVFGILTVNTRPEGALLAVFISAAGVSLRSQQIRSVIWANHDGLPGMFGQMIIEVLILALVLFVAANMIFLFRRIAGLLKPDLQWKSPLPTGKTEKLNLLTGLLLGGQADVDYGQEKNAKSKALLDILFFLAITLGISVVMLLFVVMQSPQRGQIIFALFASFLVAAMVAHHKFPTPYMIVAWVMPVLVAVVFYALAALTDIGNLPQGWVDVPLYARALPVDWITAGGGGSIVGVWISHRIREAHHFEKIEQEQQA